MDETGISLVDSQAIGPVAHLESFGDAGDARFSPDGKQYAYFNLHDGLSLYDFDRVTGQLSNLRRLEWDPLDEFNWAGAIEFSPNSRFIYIVNETQLFQVDTWEDNLETGLEWIADWDGFSDPLPTGFFALGLGPDCKVYCRSGNGVNVFHTIHNPDNKGQACNFIQRDLLLPNISSAGAFPNVPRFRVDETEKCDSTITMVNGVTVYWRRDLTLYPNPASDQLTIELPDNKQGAVTIYDIQGQVAHTASCTGSLSHLHMDVTGLPEGTYSVEFLPAQKGNNRIWSSQLIISR